MEELIAKRYAQALSSACGNLDDVVGVLNVLSQSIDADVLKTLNSPIIANEKKIDMILSAIGDNADKHLVNLIKILGENGRLNLIPAVTKVLNSDQQRKANEYEGVVTSSSDLDAESLKELESSLKEYTGSTIKLKQEKTDLNGMKVSVDDLGIEVNFSKQRVKEQLIDFIKKSL